MATDLVTRRDEEKKLPIGTVAMFFNKTVQWVRWCERAGYFRRDDGSQIRPERTAPPRAKHGYRKYSLVDVADMADSLRDLKKISEAEHRVIIERVQSFRIS